MNYPTPEAEREYIDREEELRKLCAERERLDRRIGELLDQQLDYEDDVLF